MAAGSALQNRSRDVSMDLRLHQPSRVEFPIAGVVDCEFSGGSEGLIHMSADYIEHLIRRGCMDPYVGDVYIREFFPSGRQLDLPDPLDELLRKVKERCRRRLWREQ